MNRRNFIVCGGAFLATAVILKELPETCNSLSLIWPKTAYDYNDRWNIHWTGFRSSPHHTKIVGHWIAHPTKKNTNRFSIQSTVLIVVPYYASPGIFAHITNIKPTSEDRYDIQLGLNIMLDMIEKGDKIAAKHNIKGTIPVDYNGRIDKQLFSQMRREHERMGIWPS